MVSLFQQWDSISYLLYLPSQPLSAGNDCCRAAAYTGMSTVDRYLAQRVVFFWPIVDGSRLEASLFTYHYAGQVFVGWALLVMESLRGGEEGQRWGKGPLGLMLWGLAVLAFGYSVVLPWYFIIHLLTSSTASLSSLAQLEEYLLDVASTASVVPAMAIGFFLPTVLMALPAPSVLTYEQKQAMIAIWHFFPLYVGFAQIFLHLFFEVALSSPSSESKGTDRIQSRRENNRNSIWAMRMLYAFLILCGARDQLSTNHFVALAHAFPALFAPEYRGVWNIWNVFAQKSITPAVKMNSVGEGVLLFLQYDENVGNVAMIVWAGVLFARTRRNDRSAAEKLRWRIVVGVGFVTAVFTGAMGLAAGFLWGRDEIAFAGIEEEEEGGEKKDL